MACAARIHSDIAKEKTNRNRALQFERNPTANRFAGDSPEVGLPGSEPLVVASNRLVGLDPQEEVQMQALTPEVLLAAVAVEAEAAVGRRYPVKHRHRVPVEAAPTAHL